MDEYFGLMKTKFVDCGIPVIIGEFGAIKRSLTGTSLTEHLAARQYYYEYCTKAATSNGMIPICWDNGYPDAENTFGLFDRSTGEVVDTGVVDAIMDGVSTCFSIFEPVDSLGGKWSDEWGWIDDSYLPWVYSYDGENWFYVYSGLDADTENGYWIAYYTSDCSDYGWGYVYPSNGWWKFTSDMTATWIDY